MAEKKIIDIDVNINLEGAKAKIKDLNSEISTISTTSKTSNEKINTSFRGSQAAADRLKGGVGGISEQLVLVGKAAKTGGAAMKSAFISTGVGLLIVALSTIVEYWDDIVDFVKGTNKELERQNNLIKDNISLLDSKIKNAESERKLLEAQGKSTKEIIEYQKTLLLNKKTLLESDLRILKTQLENEASKDRELSLLEKILIASGNTGSVLASEEQKKATKERIKAIEELETSLNDLALAEINLNNPQTPEGDTTKRDKIVGIGSLPTAEEQEAENIKRAERFAQVFELEANNKQTLIDLNKSALDQIGQDTSIAAAKSIDDANKTAAAKIRIGELEAQARQNQLQMIAAALQGFASIAGESTALGKGLAVASTAISTYTTAQKAYEAAFLPVPTLASPALGAAFAGVAVAGGLLNIKKILSVKTPGGKGSGGVSLPSRSAQAAQAPQFNIVGQSGVNQLAESIGSQEAKPVRAYVTSNDVTTAQGMDRAIVQGATID
jgi:hypothetical protein